MMTPADLSLRFDAAFEKISRRFHQNPNEFPDAFAHAWFKLPFSPCRMDATQEQTDVESFKVLQPVADGFRNYTREALEGLTAEMLLDKAGLLTLTAPEMTVFSEAVCEPWA